MDRILLTIESIRNDVSSTALASYAFALLFLIHQVLHHFDIAVLSPRDTFWNALVYITPARLVLSYEKRKELHVASWSQVHAAKSEAMRNVLGLSSQALMQQVPGVSGIARRLSMAAGARPSTESDAPAGLGNWDNSCYQNSVLQGLSSLGSLEKFLSTQQSRMTEQGTLAALYEITTKLRDPVNNGRHIWTPAKLKSMSSWQQQDAQEYFSKIMDELDKDLKKTQKIPDLDGLEKAGEDKKMFEASNRDFVQNPLEGLLAQHVACTACGFSEGLSMIPFNCLTVPLGGEPSYQLEDCLNQYTELESITDVECTKCTLLKAQRELRKMAAQDKPEEQELNAMLQLPPEVRTQIMERLQRVQHAIDNDDFSDEAMSQCQISKKARVSSTKTRQALIGRVPNNLVVHVNRSVFDELTGMQRKNYAAVRYPSNLDLGPWILGSDAESRISGLPREDLWKYIYRLKAVVTHYGRHENGHYIAYRQTPACIETNTMKQQWWRLSDEDVSPCSDESVMNQGGVFMLFYERVHEHAPTEVMTQRESAVGMKESDNIITQLGSVEPARPPVTANIYPDALDDDELKLPEDLEPALLTTDAVGRAMSEASMTEDETDSAAEPVLPPIRPVQSSPIMMRTANVLDGNQWTAGRYIAAT